MSEIERVIELARRLIAEGHLDNEADARLAAVRIVCAAEASHGVDEANDDKG
jgi:hypothetical protein